MADIDPNVSDLEATAVELIEALRGSFDALTAAQRKNIATTEAVSASVKDLNSQFVNVGASLYVASQAFSLLTGVFSEFVKASANAETANKKLETATGDSAASFEIFADNIERTTTANRYAVETGMALAANIGVQTQQLEQVTKVGLGLSHAFQVSESEGIKMAAEAVNGQFSLQTSRVLNLSKSASAQENLNRVNDLGVKGYTQLTQQSNTFSGSLAQMYNQLNEVAAIIGDTFVPALAHTNNLIKSIAESLREFPVLLHLIGAVLGFLGQIAIALVGISLLSRVLGVIWTSIASGAMMVWKIIGGIWGILKLVPKVLDQIVEVIIGLFMDLVEINGLWMALAGGGTLLVIAAGLATIVTFWVKMKNAIDDANEALTEQVAKSQELSNIYARRASVKGQPKDNYTLENYSKEREDTNAKINELYGKMGTNTKAALTGNSGGFGPWGKVFAPWFEGGVDEQQMIEAKQLQKHLNDINQRAIKDGILNIGDEPKDNNSLQSQANNPQKAKLQEINKTFTEMAALSLLGGGQHIDPQLREARIANNYLRVIAFHSENNANATKTLGKKLQIGYH